MPCRSKWMRSLRWMLVLAAVVTTGCGGSEEEEHYPTLFQQYGGAGSWPNSALNMAKFDQRFAWSDGESSANLCEGIVRILNQEGPVWSGNVERGVHHWGIRERCHSRAEIAGRVEMDGSIRFTLAQERWGACTAAGPGQYTGQLHGNRLLATGVTLLQCDDGREATVTETISGSYPAPDGSHDT